MAFGSHLPPGRPRALHRRIDSHRSITTFKQIVYGVYRVAFSLKFLLTPVRFKNGAAASLVVTRSMPCTPLVAGLVASAQNCANPAHDLSAECEGRMKKMALFGFGPGRRTF